MSAITLSATIPRRRAAFRFSEELLLSAILGAMVLLPVAEIALRSMGGESRFERQPCDPLVRRRRLIYSRHTREFSMPGFFSRGDTLSAHTATTPRRMIARGSDASPAQNRRPPCH